MGKKEVIHINMNQVKEEELETEDLRSFNTARLEWEWHLHQKLREVPEEEPDRDWSCSPEVEAKARRLAEESVSRMGGEVKVGQLRMLADTDVPTYIAVLKEWCNGMWLIAPFSHYRYPGAEKDLRATSVRGIHCNVIQCWMVQTLCSETLARSWVEEDIELSKEDIDAALLVWNSTFADVEIPDEILRRTGSDEPVLNRDHWLLKYQEEAMKNFEGVSAKDLATLDGDEDDEEGEEEPEAQEEEP